MPANGNGAPSDIEIKTLARQQAQRVLVTSDAFKALPFKDQKDVYMSMVNDNIDNLRRSRTNGNGSVARSMATDSGKDMGYKGYDPAFGGETKAFKELVDSVDFPKFVADLLKAVFDANLSVMKTQTDTYIKLMKEATKSAADFIKQVKDDDTFARLAETRGEQYNVTTEKGPDGSMKLALTDPQGDKVDTEDATVKQHILEAKINMAKEHRAALREVILMGVTRLIVKKGEIDAGVEFSIKATRNSTAHHEDQNINTTSVDAAWDSPLGGLLGGPSGNISSTNTNIQINTSDKKATDDLTATLKGNVKIEFATDYFKLDNFLTMYGDGGVAGLKQNGQGGAAGGAGAPAALPRT